MPSARCCLPHAPAVVWLCSGGALGLARTHTDEYDKDNSGHISVEEFQNALRNKKRGPRPGEKSTLAERQAAQGISILDISESVFTEMDKDGDGQVRDHARPHVQWSAPPCSMECTRARDIARGCASLERCGSTHYESPSCVCVVCVCVCVSGVVRPPAAHVSNAPLPPRADHPPMADHARSLCVYPLRVSKCEHAGHV